MGGGGARRKAWVSHQRATTVMSGEVVFRLLAHSGTNRMQKHTQAYGRVHSSSHQHTCLPRAGAKLVMLVFHAGHIEKVAI